MKYLIVILLLAIPQMSFACKSSPEEQAARIANAKAEYDPDADGFVTKEEFQNRYNKYNEGIIAKQNEFTFSDLGGFFTGKEEQEVINQEQIEKYWQRHKDSMPTYKKRLESHNQAIPSEDNLIEIERIAKAINSDDMITTEYIVTTTQTRKCGGGR